MRVAAWTVRWQQPGWRRAGGSDGDGLVVAARFVLGDRGLFTGDVVGGGGQVAAQAEGECGGRGAADGTGVVGDEEPADGAGVVGVEGPRHRAGVVADDCPAHGAGVVAGQRPGGGPDGVLALVQLGEHGVLPFVTWRAALRPALAQVPAEGAWYRMTQVWSLLGDVRYEDGSGVLGHLR